MVLHGSSVGAWCAHDTDILIVSCARVSSWLHILAAALPVGYAHDQDLCAQKNHGGRAPLAPWHRRGPAYVARRVAIAVGFALMTALFALMAVAVMMGILEAAPPVADAIVSAVLVVGVGASVVAGFRWRRAYWAGPPLTPAERRTRRRQGTRGLGTGFVAGLGTPFLAGFFLAIVANTLGRYVTVEERDAVAAVAAWERDRGAPGGR